MRVRSGIASYSQHAHNSPGVLVMGPTKTTRMVWTLGEADREIKADHVKDAACLNLLHDERHGRLHFRFRICKSDMTVVCGYLGQTRDAGQSAIDLTDATEEVYKLVCTKFANAPSGSSVVPKFDPYLFQHLKQITEAISIDSAAHGLVSAGDMSSDTSMQEQALTPHCRFVLLDCPHKARRLLRPWKVDAVLDGVRGFFALGNHLRANLSITVMSCARSIGNPSPRQLQMLALTLSLHPCAVPSTGWRRR